MTTTTNTTRYASSGAVNQNGGTLPIRKCKTCGHEIVWCESRKTGKSYPVDVRYSRSGRAPYYMGNDIHKCRPEVTVWAVLANVNGKGIVFARSTVEAEVTAWLGKIEMLVATGEDIASATICKVTTRDPETYLSNGWVGADHWVLEGETVQTLTFGGAK